MLRDYRFGPTGGLFDLNRDGKLNFYEKAMEYEFMNSFLKDDDEDDDPDLDGDLDLDDDDLDEDYNDNDDDDEDSDEDDYF